MSCTSHNPLASYQTHDPFIALSRDRYDPISMLFESRETKKHSRFLHRVEGLFFVLFGRLLDLGDDTGLDICCSVLSGCHRARSV